MTFDAFEGSADEFVITRCLLQVHQAMRNVTTNERLNSFRYTYLKDGNGKFFNPFDQGILRNLQEFFHFKKPLDIVSNVFRELGEVV